MLVTLLALGAPRNGSSPLVMSAGGFVVLGFARQQRLRRESLKVAEPANDAALAVLPTLWSGALPPQGWAMPSLDQMQEIQDMLSRDSIEIAISKGVKARVDTDDVLTVINAGPWRLANTDRDTPYVMRDSYLPDGRKTVEYLHTFLTGWPYVDHANGDCLDNRRSNLREATPAQNAQNRKIRSDNRSGFKGVSRNGKGKKWGAQITVNGERHWLGSFDTPEEAARSYDQAALDLFGEFAATNYPVDGHRRARTGA